MNCLGLTIILKRYSLLNEIVPLKFLTKKTLI